MAKSPSPLLRKLTANPKRIFLIDATGAVLTAVLLSMVLARFEEFFGMPQELLYYLAGVAGLFAVYSLACYLVFPFKWRHLMRFIAMANLSYCFVTLGLLVYYWKGLSSWGIFYFLAETLVIIVLVYIESTAAAGNKQ